MNVDVDSRRAFNSLLLQTTRSGKLRFFLRRICSVRALGDMPQAHYMFPQPLPRGGVGTTRRSDQENPLGFLLFFNLQTASLTTRLGSKRRSNSRRGVFCGAAGKNCLRCFCITGVTLYSHLLTFRCKQMLMKGLSTQCAATVQIGSREHVDLLFAISVQLTCCRVILRKQNLICSVSRWQVAMEEQEGAAQEQCINADWRVSLGGSFTQYTRIDVQPSPYAHVVSLICCTLTGGWWRTRRKSWPSTSGRPRLVLHGACAGQWLAARLET